MPFLDPLAATRVRAALAAQALTQPVPQPSPPPFSPAEEPPVSPVASPIAGPPGAWSPELAGSVPQPVQEPANVTAARERARALLGPERFAETERQIQETAAAQERPGRGVGSLGGLAERSALFGGVEFPWGALGALYGGGEKAGFAALEAASHLQPGAGGARLREAIATARTDPGIAASVVRQLVNPVNLATAFIAPSVPLIGRVGSTVGRGLAFNVGAQVGAEQIGRVLPEDMPMPFRLASQLGVGALTGAAAVGALRGIPAGARALEQGAVRQALREAAGPLNTYEGPFRRGFIATPEGPFPIAPGGAPLQRLQIAGGALGLPFDPEVEQAQRELLRAVDVQHGRLRRSGAGAEAIAQGRAQQISQMDQAFEEAIARGESPGNALEAEGRARFMGGEGSMTREMMQPLEVAPRTQEILKDAIGRARRENLIQPHTGQRLLKAMNDAIDGTRLLQENEIGLIRVHFGDELADALAQTRMEPDRALRSDQASIRRARAVRFSERGEQPVTSPGLAVEKAGGPEIAQSTIGTSRELLAGQSERAALARVSGKARGGIPIHTYAELRAAAEQAKQLSGTAFGQAGEFGVPDAAEIAGARAKATALAQSIRKARVVVSQSNIDAISRRLDTLRQLEGEGIENPLLRNLVSAERGGLDASISQWLHSAGVAGVASHVAFEASALPMRVITAFDMSMLLRQGLLLARHVPEQMTAIRAMVSSFYSEERAQALLAEISTRPTAPLHKRYALFLAQMGDDLTKREEQMISRWADKIGFVRMSTRAGVVYLNRLRADVFDNQLAEWARQGYQPNEKQLFDYAQYINHASGRGDIGFLPARAQAYLAPFFAPRLFVSRIQTPLDLFRTDPLVRKEVAKDLFAFVGAGVGALTLLKLSGAADVEVDPRSSDFGKIRIGHTRLDFWAGEQQIARYVAQIISGQTKSTGTGEVSDVARKSVFAHFLRSKLAPVPGLVADVATGETFVGEKVTGSLGGIGTRVFESLAPLFIQDMVQAAQEEGIPGIFKSSPSFFGAGVTTFVTPGERQAAVEAPIATRLGTTPEALRESAGPRAAPQKLFEAATPEEQAAIQTVVTQNRERGKETPVDRLMRDARDDITRLSAGVSDNVEYRKRVGAVLATRAQALEAENTKFPAPKTEAEKDLNSWYGLWRQAEEESTKTQEHVSDVFDRLEAGLIKDWAPERKKRLLDNVYAVPDPNADPRFRQFQIVKRDLAESGFWDLRDKAWRNIQNAAIEQNPEQFGFLRSFKDFAAFQRFAEEQATSEIRSGRTRPGESVEQVIRNSPTLDRVLEQYTNANQHYEQAWMLKVGRAGQSSLIRQAWLFGYLDLDEPERTALAAAGVNVVDPRISVGVR